MKEVQADEHALAVVDTLNGEKKAWSFEVVTHLVLDREVIVLGRLLVDGVVKMAFGRSTASGDGVGSDASVGTRLQAAANEALARAARLFGVGLVFERGREKPQPVSRPDGDATTSQNRITQRQLGALQGHARRRNLGRAQLADLLRARFGKSELVTLTRREASELLTDLADANGRPAA